METRPYERDDLKECVELFISVFSKEPWNDRWPSFDRAKEYIQNIVETPGFRGYVTLKESRITGMILGHIVKWWEGDEFFIKEFFIDTKNQSQGVGTILHEYMRKSLNRENVKNIILLTQKDVPALEFYKKRGFNVSEDTVFMYQGIKI